MSDGEMGRSVTSGSVLMSEVSPVFANVTSEWVNHSWMMCHCIRRILERAYGNALRELTHG